MVAFAEARGVVVIPEIESPAHSSQIAVAYPNMSAVAYDSNNNSFYCLVDPSNPALFGSFWPSVWGGVNATFPSRTWHIGGDEFWPCWSESPTVAAWMASRGFTVDDAYYWYEQQVIGTVRSFGKRTMAWQDIAGIAANYSAYPDVTLEVWTGCYSGSWQDDVSALTAAGAHVVLAGPYYITHDPQHFTWQDMYSTDPTNATAPMSPAQQALVQGGELCAWDDAVTSDAGDILVDITPYLFAVAETWWSPTTVTHSPPDLNRLHMARCRIVSRGVPSHPIYGFGAYCAFEYEAQLAPWSAAELLPAA